VSHPIVKVVSGMLHGGDVEGAERALAVIADQEGDLALSRIIDEMPARDVVAILREHDASHASIVGELISPGQFAAAVALERDYGERTNEALRGMVNAVVFADEDRCDEFISALGASEACLNALCDYFSERHEEVERFYRHGTFDPNAGDEGDEIPDSNEDLRHGDLDADERSEVVTLAEVRDRDWRELAWRLRVDHYEIFCTVLEILRARHHRAAAMLARLRDRDAPDDDEDDVL
jgi:hypothetical protein